MSKAKINSQEDRNLWWSRLNAIEDPKEFWVLYTQYLEWEKIYSPSRQKIYQMAKKTVEQLNANP